MAINFGIDKLRQAVKLFNNCFETFNQRFDAEDLIRIYEAYDRSEFDISPDQWDARQLRECLEFGHPPAWKESTNGDLEPIYLNPGNKEYLVEATWMVIAKVLVNANNSKDAEEWAWGDMPLPKSGEYLDDSFKVEGVSSHADEDD